MQIRITKTRAAMAALFVLAGVGLGNLLSPLVGSALATVGQTVNISDRSASAYFAKVSSDGKLAVGDGAGLLTVDGTVSDRPSPPSSPWRITANMDVNSYTYIGPSASPINLTSLSLSTDGASGASTSLTLIGAHVANNATNCLGAIFVAELWKINDLGDGVTPLEFTFPTPLQFKPPANTKACVLVSTSSGPLVTMNAVGFYGG